MDIGGSHVTRRWRWWMPVVAAVVAGVAYWLLRDSQPAAPTLAPRLVAVAIGDVENIVTASGTLKPATSVEVGAQVSGQLQKLHVRVGDDVEPGTLLAEIDASLQRAEVEAASASLHAQESQMAAVQSALELAKLNSDRQQRLIGEDATTQADVDSALDRLIAAQTNVVSLESQIAQSRASLASQETLLGFTRIFAPIGGTVVSIETQEGQTINAVQQAPTILRIADLTRMTVEAAVSEADVGQLVPGMPVYFTTLGGGERRWEGTLRQVLPTPKVDGNVVQFSALFDIDNTDRSLFTEMTAQVFFVVSAARDVLTVPLAALSLPGAPPGMPPSAAFRPTGTEVVERPATVRVVAASGELTTRDIVVGAISRTLAEVRDGLEAGEQVAAGLVGPPGLAGPPR